jgi:hypothetical protein
MLYKTPLSKQKPTRARSTKKSGRVLLSENVICVFGEQKKSAKPTGKSLKRNEQIKFSSLDQCSCVAKYEVKSGNNGCKKWNEQTKSNPTMNQTSQALIWIFTLKS